MEDTTAPVYDREECSNSGDVMGIAVHGRSDDTKGLGEGIQASRSSSDDANDVFDFGMGFGAAPWLDGGSKGQWHYRNGIGYWN